MTREQFIERQAEELDRLFALTEGEDERRRRFEELALDTYDFLVAHGARVARP
jgi:hypothetical protein